MLGGHPHGPVSGTQCLHVTDLPHLTVVWKCQRTLNQPRLISSTVAFGVPHEPVASASFQV